MGALECCFGTSVDHTETPDPETRRQQMLNAAEERRKKEESRGIKDPERFKEQQQRKLEAEKLSNQQTGSTPLQWTVG